MLYSPHIDMNGQPCWIPGAWDGCQNSVAEAEHASEGGKEINPLTLSTPLDWEAKLLRDEYL